MKKGFDKTVCEHCGADLRKAAPKEERFCRNQNCPKKGENQRGYVIDKGKPAV